MLETTRYKTAAGASQEVTPTTPLPTTLLPLDADTDTISIKNAIGTVTTVHNAIAASVAAASCVETDCGGHNSLRIFVTLSAAKTWVFALYGAAALGGNYGPVMVDVEGTWTAVSITQATADTRVYIIRDIPRFVKIVPTESEDTATATVSIQPFNS